MLQTTFREALDRLDEMESDLAERVRRVREQRDSLARAVRFLQAKEAKQAGISGATPGVSVYDAAVLQSERDPAERARFEQGLRQAAPENPGRRYGRLRRLDAAQADSGRPGGGLLDESVLAFIQGMDEGREEASLRQALDQRLGQHIARAYADVGRRRTLGNAGEIESLPLPAVPDFTGAKTLRERIQRVGIAAGDRPVDSREVARLLVRERLSRAKPGKLRQEVMRAVRERPDLYEELEDGRFRYTGPARPDAGDEETRGEERWQRTRETETGEA